MKPLILDPNSAHTGKIARLPRTLRDEIDRRLDENETANTILSWLNQLPEVKATGAVISPQNLSNWRLGAHQEWVQRQEIDLRARDLATDALHLKGGADISPLGHDLSVVWLADFAANAQTFLLKVTDPW